jgi:hypothetical protein
VVGSVSSRRVDKRRREQTDGDSSFLFYLEGVEDLLVLHLPIRLVECLLFQRNRTRHFEHAVGESTYESNKH